MMITDVTRSIARLQDGMTHIVLSVVVAGLVCCAPQAAAQAYPGKAIRLIVAFPPGGNVDITARILGAALTEQFGQSVFVDNRAGGDGMIGGSLVAKSAPDGYTLLVASGGSMTIAPATTANMPYDPAKDFTAIGMVQISPYALVASFRTPVASLDLRGLIAFAKKRPGQVTVSYSAGPAPLLAIELLQNMGGVKLLPVPYKGSVQAMSELVGGQVDTLMTNLPSVIGFLREGRLKGLAVTTLKRSSVMPDIPTLDESGLRGFEASTFIGVLGPAATPQPIVKTFNEAVLRVVRSAAIREKFRDMGADPQETTPEQFSATIRNDIDKWKKVARAAGMKAE